MPNLQRLHPLLYCFAFLLLTTLGWTTPGLAQASSASANASEAVELTDSGLLPVPEALVQVENPKAALAQGCGACDVGMLCANLSGQACNGMTNAIATGNGFEAALGGLLFGGLGSIAGAVVGAGVGALIGLAYVFVGVSNSGAPRTAAYINGAVVFGVLGAIAGALIGLGMGAVAGIQAGPTMFKSKPPPPPPRAKKSSPGGKRVVKAIDVFAY